MQKRIILVGEEHEPELKDAMKICAGVDPMVGTDSYQFIKTRLKLRGVPHRELNMNIGDIPLGHAFYHSQE